MPYFNLNYFNFKLLFKHEHGWVPTTLVMGLSGCNGPPHQEKVEVIHALLYYFLYQLILDK